jgi:putative intracellular protease/amidase
MNILIIMTSHGELGSSGYRTGVWLEEFTTAYYVLRDAGAELTLASPRGGQPPIDPRSDLPAEATASIQRFRGDREARALFADTVRLDDVDAGDFDGVYVPGGHGAMWDLAEDARCGALLTAFHAATKPMALVCRGPAALRRAVDAAGAPLVRDRSVTAFADSEEASTGLAGVVPFSLQEELIRLGGRYAKGPDWAPHVVRDGFLITAQNPASAEAAARALLGALG